MAFEEQVPAAEGLESKPLKDSKFEMYVVLHGWELLLQGGPKALVEPSQRQTDGPATRGSVDRGRGCDSNIKYVTQCGYLTAGIPQDKTFCRGGGGAAVCRLHCPVSGRLCTQKGLRCCSHACACVCEFSCLQISTRVCRRVLVYSQEDTCVRGMRTN